MYTNAGKTNIHKTNKLLKVKAKLINRLNQWLAKIGRAMNVEQQSYYK